jgi:hypothetical protein
MALQLDTTPLWTTTPVRSFPPLSTDLDVDVVVIGAGITGMTAAYSWRLPGGRSRSSIGVNPAPSTPVIRRLI